MKIQRTRLFLLVLAMVSVLGGSMKAAGADTWLVGDEYHDIAGITWKAGGKSCTLTAGNPVVVTVNGARMLRAVNTISCDGIVDMGPFASRLDRYAPDPFSPSGPVQEKASVGTVTASKATAVIEISCRNAVNTSYAGYFKVMVDGNRDGVSDMGAYDYSPWNLRSCGV